MGKRLLIVHAGFVLTGVVTTLLGPLIPTLEVRWALNDAQAGRLFAAQFLGALAGTLACGRVVSRCGIENGVVLGYLIMALGVTAAAANQWMAGMAAVACYGIGLGFTIPLTNLLVSDLCPGRRAAALNLLNVAWCAGAVAAPPAIAAMLRTGGPAPLLYSLGGSLAGVAALVWLTSRPVVEARGSAAAPATPRRVPATVWLTGILLFLYVGVETGVAGWMPSYALREYQLPAARIATVQAGFWSALLMGRLLAPLALRRVAAERLIVMGLAAAAAGAALLPAVADAAALWVGALVTGAGLAVVFPTAVALFTAREGSGASRMAGIVFAMASLGGAAIPWAVGYVSSHLHSLRLAMWGLLAATLLMIVVQLRLSGARQAH